MPRRLVKGGRNHRKKYAKAMKGVQPSTLWEQREVGCPQHQAGGHKGGAWSNLTPLGISPLPLKRPWVGAGRVGAVEWEKWLMVHGGSWAWGWDSHLDNWGLGGSMPCIKNPGAQEAYLL